MGGGLGALEQSQGGQEGTEAPTPPSIRQTPYL